MGRRGLTAQGGLADETYYAAVIDANLFRPLMLSVANFLNNRMDQYFVFQNAFNKTHIQVLDLYVYNLGISGSSISLATAISMMKSVVSVTLLVFVNFVSKRVRGESII